MTARVMPASGRAIEVRAPEIPPVRHDRVVTWAHRAPPTRDDLDEMWRWMPCLLVAKRALRTIARAGRALT